MAKKKWDDNDKEKKDEEETEEEKAKGGEQAAIDSDMLEASLDEPVLADPLEEDLDGMGHFLHALPEDDPEEEAPDFDRMD